MNPILSEVSNIDVSARNRYLMALADAGAAAAPLPAYSFLATKSKEAMLASQLNSLKQLQMESALAAELLQKKLEDQRSLQMDLLALTAASSYLPGCSSLPVNPLNTPANGLKCAAGDSIAPSLPRRRVPARKSTRGRKATFPLKLHQMLSDLKKEESGEEIAAFLPGGHAFVILKPKKFAETIMPKYFNMSNFSSFQRQLNLYEFQRIKNGPDKGAYYHEMFVQDKPSMCKAMRRIKIKGDKALLSY